MKNKYIAITIVIVALVLAAVIGSYVFAIGAFLFKVMLGLVAIIIFVIGIFCWKIFSIQRRKKGTIDSP